MLKPGDPVLPDRFWRKVSVNSETGCWEWIAALRSNGYGAYFAGPDDRNALAHRVAYRTLVEAIPPGLDLDHLCRVRRCVNPAHLEPVTRRTNLLRGETVVAARAAQTHCVNGHEFDAANTYIRSAGTRDCRACHRNRERRRAHVKRQAMVTFGV
ncbi:HNH endonuclease signature motif containing protein [Lentzea sp. NBRC 102530]|uniref:HNH endonuclease signature motif containing protein n=1 Tax=Lentzea sp. NBRC 102530 TaxID=3032201 RepID=UPI00331E4322